MRRLRHAWLLSAFALTACWPFWRPAEPTELLRGEPYAHGRAEITAGGSTVVLPHVHGAVDTPPGSPPVHSITWLDRPDTWTLSVDYVDGSPHESLVVIVHPDAAGGRLLSQGPIRSAPAGRGGCELSVRRGDASGFDGSLRCDRLPTRPYGEGYDSDLPITAGAAFSFTADVVAVTEPGAEPHEAPTLPATASPATPSPTPARASPTVAPTPTPEPTFDARRWPPPPDSFDPSTIRWAGRSDDGSVWVGAIDGSDLQRVAMSGSVLGPADGGVVYNTPTDGQGGSDLWYAEPGRERRRLATRVVGGTAPVAAGAVYVARARVQADETRDDGVWRIPLDGSSPTEVLPPWTGGVGLKKGGPPWPRGDIAVSTDGEEVAAAGVGIDYTIEISVKFRGRRTEVPGLVGEPLGFDARGRLVMTGEALAEELGEDPTSPLAVPAYDPRTRRFTDLGGNGMPA